MICMIYIYICIYDMYDRYIYIYIFLCMYMSKNMGRSSGKYGKNIEKIWEDHLHVRE